MLDRLFPKVTKSIYNILISDFFILILVSKNHMHVSNKEISKEVETISVSLESLVPSLWEWCYCPFV